MKTLPLQSANFKRDYVATLAVVLFVSIVAAEVALAIAIPSYLRSENAMVLEKRRDQLKSSIDATRRRCARLKLKEGSAADMERQLISWNLELLVSYMRDNSEQLTGDEIARIQAAVNNCISVLTTLEGYSRPDPKDKKRKIKVPGRSLSQERELRIDRYIDSLIK